MNLSRARYDTFLSDKPDLVIISQIRSLIAIILSEYHPVNPASTFLYHNTGRPRIPISAKANGPGTLGEGAGILSSRITMPGGRLISGTFTGEAQTAHANDLKPSNMRVK